ncbi:MAG TPA: winged helix-turn-helix transcriptional regulator [Vicinamibacterales bacterium]|nr:winged helix-turn-helix transcriptional regulator [Vicinamibacterales bacterium]
MPNPDSIRLILEVIEANPSVSQRALATRLGVSLGTVNQLVRGLVGQRWLRPVPARGRRSQLTVTPEGRVARDRMWREHMESALIVYGSVRDRICRGLRACSAAAPAGGFPAVVLYGVGDIARMAFACAADSGVRLVGFVDDSPIDSFLGLPVCPPDELKTLALDGRTFDWLVVTTLVDQDAVRGRLQAVGFPLERVNWL